jgi:hypothetical protein
MDLGTGTDQHRAAAALPGQRDLANPWRGSARISAAQPLIEPLGLPTPAYGK